MGGLSPISSSTREISVERLSNSQAAEFIQSTSSGNKFKTSKPSHHHHVFFQ